MGKATRSGRMTAKVLGVTSLNRITNTVKATGAATSTVGESPYSCVTSSEKMKVAAMLTRLLPIRITPIRRSGRASSAWARRALRWPVLARWRSR